MGGQGEQQGEQSEQELPHRESQLFGKTPNPELVPLLQSENCRQFGLPPLTLHTICAHLIYARMELPEAYYVEIRSDV